MKYFDSTGLKRLLALLGILAAGSVSSCSEAPHTSVELPQLSPNAAQWIGTQVFQNECSGRKSCLVHWNEGEAFPSLGIGHFIWYPTDADGPFKESFPLMIQSLSRQGIALPTLLEDLDPFDAPWQTRSEFLAAADSPAVAELRKFLWATRGAQTDFLIERASQALRRITDRAPAERQSFVASQIRALLQTPGGVYALIDYINFKGEGLVATERYRGQGWGLLQALLSMPDDGNVPALERFRISARAVLTRRAENAATDREKEQWLPGWLTRIETYREP